MVEITNFGQNILKHLFSVADIAIKVLWNCCKEVKLWAIWLSKISYIYIFIKMENATAYDMQQGGNFKVVNDKTNQRKIASLFLDNMKQKRPLWKVGEDDMWLGHFYWPS